MSRFIIRNRSIRQRAVEAVSVITSDVIQEVVIKPHVYSKTVEQRNFWHTLLREFANNQGMTEGQIKLIVKAHVFGAEKVSYAGVDLIVPLKHTEKLNRRDYSQLIEQTYLLAGEAGISLPPAMRGEYDG